jgi:hypothetical protein
VPPPRVCHFGGLLQGGVRRCSRRDKRRQNASRHERHATDRTTNERLKEPAARAHWSCTDRNTTSRTEKECPITRCNSIILLLLLPRLLLLLLRTLLLRLLLLLLRPLLQPQHALDQPTGPSRPTCACPWPYCWLESGSPVQQAPRRANGGGFSSEGRLSQDDVRFEVSAAGWQEPAQ